jgi:hypothetical protein
MKKLLALAMCCLCMLLSATQLSAEVWTMEWDPVTTYTDNTLIPSSLFPVYYDGYWSSTSDFSSPGIHTLFTSETNASHAFDVITEGMPRQTTIYFSAKSRLSDGATSDFAPAYAWYVPPLPSPSVPGKPILSNASLYR